MQEQRDRAKADARAKKGAHRDATAYRAVADALGAPVEFTGYSETVTDGSVRGLVTADGVVDSVREGDEVELVLDRTPFYAEGGGQLADQGVDRARQRRAARGPRRAVADHRPDRAPGDGALRRGHPRARGALAGRPRAPAGDLARPHRDPHGAQGVPRGAGRDRDPGRLGERARPVPLRLLRDRRGAGLGDGRRRGAGQRRDPRRPGGARRDHEPGRGGQVRRDGAVRREVRRPGPRRLGRRLGPRAVRRHPRRRAPASSA